MPPRFPEESVACLKRTMLVRQPHFMFNANDVENVMKETGLENAQIKVWAEKFRFHYETEKARKGFLESDGIDKVRDHLPSLGSNMFSSPRLFYS